jgi:hypothetical protein
VRRAISAFLAALSLLLAVTQSMSLLPASTTLVIQEFRARGPNGGFEEFILLANGGATPADVPIMFTPRVARL